MGALADQHLRQVLVDANRGEGWWIFWSSPTVQLSEIVPIYHLLGPSGQRPLPPTPLAAWTEEPNVPRQNLNPECVSCSGFLSVTVDRGSGPMTARHFPPPFDASKTTAHIGRVFYHHARRRCPERYRWIRVVRNAPKPYRSIDSRQEPNSSTLSE